MTSTYPNSGYVVLNTIQSAGADLVLDGGVLSLGNPAVKICNWKDITIPTRVQLAVAETPQVTTITPTAANSSTYQFLIQQWNPVTRMTMTRLYTYTTAASGDTATTIGDAFRSRINSDTGYGQLQINATGTTTLILTAVAGYAVFTVSVIQAGGGFSVAATTPGVAAVGTTAALALQGITENISAAASYTQITINSNTKTGANVGNPVGPGQSLLVLLNEGASNYAALVAKFNYLFVQRVSSIGTTIEALAVA